MGILTLCLLLTTVAIATADICQDAECVYTFVISRSRSMTYRASNGRNYDVAFNGTGLQVIYVLPLVSLVQGWGWYTGHCEVRLLS